MPRTAAQGEAAGRVPGAVPGAGRRQPFRRWRCDGSDTTDRVARRIEEKCPGVGDTVVLNEVLTDDELKHYCRVGMCSPDFRVVKRRPITLERIGAGE